MERADPSDRQTLTPAELAREIDRAPKSVRRYLRNGYIKAVKLGGKWRISKADANAWWRERGGGLLFPEAGIGRTPDKERKMVDDIRGHLANSLKRKHQPYRVQAVELDEGTQVILEYGLDDDDNPQGSISEPLQEGDSPKQIADRLTDRIYS